MDSYEREDPLLRTVSDGLHWLSSLFLESEAVLRERVAGLESDRDWNRRSPFFLWAYWLRISGISKRVHWDRRELSFKLDRASSNRGHHLDSRLVALRNRGRLRHYFGWTWCSCVNTENENPDETDEKEKREEESENEDGRHRSHGFG